MSYDLAFYGFICVFVLMSLRVPIGFSLGIVGVAGYASVIGFGPAMKLLALSPLRTASNLEFAVIPLFVVMGIVARNAGISSDLFAAFRAWFGAFRGGLGLATVGACAGFAAVSGSSVATAATMAKIALPEMEAAGYDKRYAAGTVAAGGTLGILIPPSVPFMIYGILTENDIGKLFIAGVLPGILATALYMLTIRLIAWGHPDAIPLGASTTWSEKFATLSGLWATIIIFSVVIGGIYGGFLTVIEAAGVGAASTVITALAQRRIRIGGIIASLVESVRTTGTLFTMLIGAILFSNFLTITQAPQGLVGFLTGLDLPPIGILILLLIMYFVLGWFLDALAMIIITVPIVYPVIISLGYDPIWFGVVMVVAVEMGLLTPPYGINVYVINAVAPRITIPQIFRGVLPFVGMDLVRLAIIVVFPALSLFLPSLM